MYGSCDDVCDRREQQLCEQPTAGHDGLRQLRTKLKAYVAEMSCNQLLIDSAMYLLTITLKNIAMSLYDIILPAITDNWSFTSLGVAT